MGGEEGLWTRAFQIQIHLSLDWLVSSRIPGLRLKAGHLSELTLRSLASLDGDARKKLALQSYLSAVVFYQFAMCVC